MKRPIFFVFILLFESSAWAQRITNVFVDLGMNHSGITYTNSYFTGIDRTDFKNNFNPNFSSSIGIELKLKNKLNLMTGLGYRTTGTMYKLPETTVQQPDGTGRMIDIYYHFKQVTLPLLFGYNFGEKFKIQPLIGLVNNYNVSISGKSKGDNLNQVDDFYLRSYRNYTFNGLLGLMLYNQHLFNSKLGLGLKLSFEHNLIDLDAYSHLQTNQNIVSASMMLIYKLPSKN